MAPDGFMISIIIYSTGNKKKQDVYTLNHTFVAFYRTIVQFHLMYEKVKKVIKSFPHFPLQSFHGDFLSLFGSIVR